jgi:hypothetical protein
MYKDGKTREEARLTLKQNYPAISPSRCSQLLAEYWPMVDAATKNKDQYDPWDPVPLYDHEYREELSRKSLQIDLSQSEPSTTPERGSGE